MKRFLCSVAALLAMHSTAKVSAADPSVAPDFFPIMAWNTLSRDCPGDKLEQLKIMKECGINIAGFLTIEELGLAEKAGILALVLDDRGHVYNWREGVDPIVARENVSSLVNEVKGRPSVFGYYVCDEPALFSLEGVGVVTKIFRELDPDRWPYVNMLPNSADPSEIGDDYGKFLADFIWHCSPNIMSVDDYSLMAGSEAKNPGITARFYLTMKQMREASLKQGIPFWNIVMSMPHRYFVEPTRGNMARQVYASLAYGARGLSYFCYFTNDSEGSRLGPIDVHGDKTATWDIVRALNKEVHALAPTLNQLTSKRVYFLGKVPMGADAPPADAWVVNTKKHEPSENPNVLVGEFAHKDGSRYVMLVNTDATHPVVLHHDFPGAKEIYHVTAGNGSLRKHTPRYLYLAPGMGVLSKLVD